MRKLLNENKIEKNAFQKIESFHASVIQEIDAAIQGNEWVIVGMAFNPFVGKARKLLQSKQMQFKYIEHGSYLSKWQIRLAVKLWSGWPTFPQIFHKGQLIGGFQDLEKYLAKS